MKIFLGADHNGYQLKEQLEDYLKKIGHDVVDVSGNQLDPNDDFPIHASRVATDVLATKDSVGILLCGSGQGVCMAANRYKGIRASLVWNTSEARSARNDDDSNVLCLPARELKDFNFMKELVDTWLATPFDGAVRFVRRVKEMDEMN